MKTYRLKTNINCGGCIEKVSPFMTRANGIHSWKVDTNSPAKILEVLTGLEIPEVISLLDKAGFRGEPLAEGSGGHVPAQSCHN